MAAGCELLVHPCRKGWWPGIYPKFVSICCNDCQETGCTDRCSNSQAKCGYYSRGLAGPREVPKQQARRLVHVDQYTYDGTLVACWWCLQDAATEILRGPCDMHGAIKGGRPLGGFYWMKAGQPFNPQVPPPKPKEKPKKRKSQAKPKKRVLDMWHDGKVVESYPTMSEAARQLNINRSTLSNHVVTGLPLYGYTFIWRSLV